MSGSEFSGSLRERLSDAQGQAYWAAVRVEGHNAGLIGDVWRASAMWCVVMRAPVRLSLGATLDWRGKKLVVKRIAEDPLMPDRISYICEERS